MGVRDAWLGVGDSSSLVGEDEGLEFFVDLGEQVWVVDIIALSEVLAFFHEFLLVGVDLALDYIEVNGELLEDKGRAHCIDLHHKRERHDVEHIALVELAVLQHVVEEVVLAADLPVMLEVVHCLLLKRMVRQSFELDPRTDRRPLEMEQRVEVMRLHPVVVPLLQRLPYQMA